MDHSMSLDFINKFLAALPMNVVVEVSFAAEVFEKSLEGSFRLMSRDLPGPERRLTNLDSGREWFLPLSENVGITKISIPAFEIEVIP